MNASPELYWLPNRPDDWRQRARALSGTEGRERAAWQEGVALARYRLDFPATNALDSVTRDPAGGASRSRDPDREAPSARVAFLSSSTSVHLQGALRVGGLRRGMAVDIFEPDYGQYRQALADPGSALHAFAPDFIVFAFDASAVARHARDARTSQEAERLAAAYVEDLQALWTSARERTGAAIIQQTVMPRFPGIGGGNEHRLPSSPAAFVARVNARLRAASDETGIDLLALDTRVAQDGLDRWFSASSWHGAKQEVALPAAPMYGDMVARLIAARRGRSAKCCIFDLDNTLWGGVVGDEGVQGIVIGQGSAAGEAFLDLHDYALELRRRGVLIAVCSKNDEANALEPFDRHPDMGLKRADIACFVANWNDKASNIRAIAERLSIGLDALVFVDDNPFERELVRTTLPAVFVPEVPEDPALVPRCLSDSGCFEMAALTDEDARRAELYSANALRDTFKGAATDLDSYLAGLDMTLQWSRFAEPDLPRVTQLVNKTNQFNLTTRRLSENEVRAVALDTRSAGLQFRLLDRFGDNGVIAVVTGHLVDDATFAIDDWLMSCRVLGRQVEDATLNVVAAAAERLGARRIEGRYRPTKKNGMVADVLARLGFSMHSGRDGEAVGVLDLGSFDALAVPIRVLEVDDAR